MRLKETQTLFEQNRFTPKNDHMAIIYSPQADGKSGEEPFKNNFELKKTNKKNKTEKSK